MVITLELPEDRCSEMEIAAAVRSATLRRKKGEMAQTTSLLSLALGRRGRGERDLDLCVDSLEMGRERDMVNPLAPPRLASLTTSTA